MRTNERSESASALTAATLWTPARVLVTRSAFEMPHGMVIVRRCEAAGVTEIEVSRGDRLPSLRADSRRHENGDDDP